VELHNFLTLSSLLILSQAHGDSHLPFRRSNAILLEEGGEHNYESYEAPPYHRSNAILFDEAEEYNYESYEAPPYHRSNAMLFDEAEEYNYETPIRIQRDTTSMGETGEYNFESDETSVIMQTVKPYILDQTTEDSGNAFAAYFSSLNEQLASPTVLAKLRARSINLKKHKGDVLSSDVVLIEQEDHQNFQSAVEYDQSEDSNLELTQLSIHDFGLTEGGSGKDLRKGNTHIREIYE